MKNKQFINLFFECTMIDFNNEIAFEQLLVFWN